jgi:hypothetical protein
VHSEVTPPLQKWLARAILAILAAAILSWLAIQWAVGV